jgi:hypothetical protein
VLILGPLALFGLALSIPNEWPFWGQPPPQFVSTLIGVLVLAIAGGFGLRKLGEWLVK